LEQPIPEKVADNLHYEDDETEDEVSGSGIEDMMGGESEPDQAEMDTQKKTYFTEYGGQKSKNRGQGRGQGQGQGGRQKNAQNLSQEDRARGGRNSGKNRGSQKKGDDDNEDDDNDDDNQGRGKGQDGRRNNAQNLSYEDRARGGRSSAKSKGQGNQGNSGNEDEDEDYGEAKDDERSGTRYNYSWFHVIFAIGAMYVAMLLTDWNVVSTEPGPTDSEIVYIGRSETAMWMRIVSSWMCMLLYMWSLLAPLLLPDRFGDL